MADRVPFCTTSELQLVTVTYLPYGGDRAGTVEADRVAGFDVEDIAGTKFLVLTSAPWKRTFVRYDRIVAVATEPAE